MPKPLLFSAGGTGGGIYPAVSIAEALKRIAPDVPLHFIGSADGMEGKLVPRDLFAAYYDVQSGPLHGVFIGRLLTSLVKLVVGIVQAWGLIGRIRPAALLLTGGWVTFPVAIAAWLRRVPITIFLPDIEPALAVKTISRLSRLVFTTTDESVKYFPPGTTLIETGYPLRQSVIGATRAVATAHFQLDPACKTLLVFGGSRGARSINEAIGTIAPDLLAAGIQILHVTGELDWPTVQTRYEKLPLESRQRYHVFPYLHEDMGLALAAADLVVSRAGASTLGEFPYLGLPSILVPYPFAWRYQKVNADWLAARGAAIRLNDEIMGNDLLPTIQSLFKDQDRLKEMGQASAALARPDAAQTIAAKLVEFAQG